MKANLYQTVVSAHRRPRSLNIHPHLQASYQERIRPGLVRLLTNTPPIYDIGNIDRYVSRTYPEFGHPGAAALQPHPDGGFTLYCAELDRVRELFGMPLHDFPAGGCWMELIRDPEASRSPCRAWYIFATEEPLLDIMPRGRSLVFLEHEGVIGGRVNVDTGVQLVLDESGALLPECNLIGPGVSADGHASLSLLERLFPEHIARIAPALMALCVLRSSNGFSMPASEENRRTIMSRIGVRTPGSDYWFEDGPRARHFVRGHFRVYRRGRATPYTTWVVPHTRSNRKAMMSERHRRRLVQESSRSTARGH